jgi:hypothetical protein
MAINHFQPRPGRFGTMLTHAEFGNPGPIAPVAVASSTVAYRIATPKSKAYLEKINFLIGTLPTGSGTITAQWFIRNSVGSKSDAQTAATDLKTGSTLTNRAVAFTATENQRYLLDGDYLACDIVASGTITLQPADFLGTVELSILE